MKQKLNLTSNQEQEICNLYTSGFSSYKVAQQTGVSATQVRRILDKHNVKGRSTKTDDVLEKEIIAEYKAGKSSETIAKERGMNGSTVCRILKRNNEEIRPAHINKRKHQIDLDLFKEIDTEEKAYFLGFMLSDGNVYKRNSTIKITLHEQDKHILEEFSKLIFGKIVLTQDRGYPSLLITCKEYKQDLAKYGCVPAKTFITRFPFNIDKSLYKHVIRGLIDGDGNTGIYDSPIVRLTGTIELIKDLEQILAERNIKIYYYKSKKKSLNNIYDLYIRKHNHLKEFINYVYSDATIYLNRKKEYIENISSLLENKNVYTDDEIKELWAQNISISKISDIIHSHHDDTKQKLIEIGCLPKNGKDHRVIKHNTKPVSSDIKQQIPILYKDLQNITTVASKLNVSKNCVRRVLRQLNIEITQPGTPQEIKEKIIELRQQGQKVGKIAKMQNLSRGCIVKILTAAGISAHDTK